MNNNIINQYSKDIIDKQDEVIKSLTKQLNDCREKKTKYLEQMDKEREERDDFKAQLDDALIEIEERREFPNG